MDRLRPPTVAVTLTVAAGALHLVAARGHTATTLLAASMAVVGLAQLATVATARRWPRATAEAVVALDLGAVGAWAVSRTVGLPLVPGGPEAVGAGDLVVVGLQLAAVVALSVPERLAAVRTDLAPYALVVGFLAVGLAAPDVGHGHDDPAPVVQRGPGDSDRGLGIVDRGLGDGDRAPAVTDRVGADTMRAMMTGAGARAVRDGGLLPSEDGHGHGHGHGHGGHGDGGH